MSETLNFEFSIDMLYAYSLLLELMLFVTNLSETALLLKTVKPILYLGNVSLLRYILIYNLEVPFNFHLTFVH